jgi:LPXTG-site transpeptidase (sortase) family protein
MKRIISLLKIFTAFVLLIIGALVIFSESRSESRISSSSFSEEPIKVMEFSLENIPQEDKPKRIIIPSLKLDLEVKESEIVGGYWEVYENAAGWGKGSSPPGYQGNQVIFAHAKEGLFGNLDQVNLDDKVYVFNENRWYEYRVKELKEVYPGQTEVIKKTEDERLTLYTCSGFRDEKRLIIVAERL